MKNLFILILIGLAYYGNAQTSGLDIMKMYKAQEVSRDASFEATMTLINEKGRERTRQLSSWSLFEGDLRKQLIRFSSPADIAGTGFLSIEKQAQSDDNWLYLPATGRSRRISGSDKQDSFVGTDFTYEDLETEKLEDYSYRLMKEENLAGVNTWVIEAMPVSESRKKESGYDKRILWISKDHQLAVQVEYFQDNEPVKILSASDARQVSASDKWRTYRLEMEDYLKGTVTLLVFDDIKIDQGLSADRFSQRYLERPN